jgi:hypothetical protein
VTYQKWIYGTYSKSSFFGKEPICEKQEVGHASEGNYENNIAGYEGK